MNKIVFFNLLIILFCFCCSSNNKEKHLKWNINIESKKNDCYNSYLFKMKFNSKVDTTFLMDYKTFKVECYEEDKSKIEEANNQVIKIYNLITSSQVLIENSNGEMRFMSEFVYLDTTRERSFYLSNCMFDHLKKIVLKPNFIFEKEFCLNDIEDIKVTKDDKRNRLHYLFKPDSIQREMGFNEFKITSNWFKIPEH